MERGNLISPYQQFLTSIILREIPQSTQLDNIALLLDRFRFLATDDKVVGSYFKSTKVDYLSKNI